MLASAKAVVVEATLVPSKSPSGDALQVLGDQVIALMQERGFLMLDVEPLTRQVAATRPDGAIPVDALFVPQSSPLLPAVRTGTAMPAFQ